MKPHYTHTTATLRLFLCIATRVNPIFERQTTPTYFYHHKLATNIIIKQTIASQGSKHVF